ncbi:MAG: hemerythrin domain-containing protein [Polyangiaceae bacterium]|nr:hemerythrin domain-containing protein [Polyangiaceae bacterium]
MKITEGLLGEHALSYALFDQVEAATDDAASLGEVTALGRVLSRAVASHMALEHDVLFPALIERGHEGGALDVMRADHKEIELLAAAVSAAATLEEGRGVLLRLLYTLREHFEKEEQFLFPICERTLGDQKLTELGADWAKRRGLM